MADQRRTNSMGYYAPEGWVPPGGNFAVYLLRDPRTGVVRYVGTTNNPKKRLSAHCNLWRPYRYYSNTPLGMWVAELHALGLKPIMTLIYSSDLAENAARREDEERSDRWLRGEDLLNVASDNYCTKPRAYVWGAS